MDFTFTQRNPPGRLARYVESIWHARGTIPYPRERIAPTGSTAAIRRPDAGQLEALDRELAAR